MRDGEADLTGQVTAAYFYVRLIPRDLSALRLDSSPSGWVPGFGSLASGHFPSASQKTVFRKSQFISFALLNDTPWRKAFLWSHILLDRIPFSKPHLSKHTRMPRPLGRGLRRPKPMASDDEWHPLTGTWRSLLKTESSKL
jgi:hypothetical protein